MSTPRRPRLTADDWIRAALRALGERGLAAVAVEPLAAALGATKGSFYWHFPHREALVAAALERWEADRTQAAIDVAEAEEVPVARLRRLLDSVLDSVGRDPIETQLLAAADHPLVGETVRRVVGRRLAYVATLFEQIGFAPEQAAQRAALVYAAYAGHDQLALRLPGVLPLDADYRRELVRVVLSGRPSPRGPSPRRIAAGAVRTAGGATS